MLGKLADIILNGWLIAMSIMGCIMAIGMIIITSGVILIPILICLVLGLIYEGIQWVIKHLR